MSGYLFLLPLSLMLGFVGLLTFLWTLKQNQYDDLKGSSYRILDDEDVPLPQPDSPHSAEQAKRRPDQSSTD